VRSIMLVEKSGIRKNWRELSEKREMESRERE
jgi:hypothetical protein